MSSVGTHESADAGSAAPAGAERGARRSIPYQPALDGVRALAVIAVLLFHAEVAGFDGGYLGVSVFFTLSGFLITSLLAAETESDGHVALGRFYARRARRLLPASILLVALVVVASVLTDWFDAVSDLRAHVIGSLLQVANWVFLANDGSYQDLLQQAAGAASPLEHYWSLAIEEQFYWLWPIAFVGIWRRGRSRRGRIRLLGVITALFFAMAPLTAVVWGSDAAYWASPARAGEILAGAFVALAIMGRTLDPRVAWLAPAALVALAVCVVTFPTVGGPAYAGWLPAIGVLSALLLIGLQVESPVRTACSAAPLVWLGKISYGVYLFHWPIFVVMNEERMGIDGVPLLALRLVTTLVVAQLSYLLYEQPIRRSSGLAVRPTMVGAAAATAAVVGLAIVTVPSPDSDYWETDDATARAAALDADDEPLVALLDGAAVADAPTGSDLQAPVEAPTTLAAVGDDAAHDDAGTSAPAPSASSGDPAGAPTTDPAPDATAPAVTNSAPAEVTTIAPSAQSVPAESTPGQSAPSSTPGPTTTAVPADLAPTPIPELSRPVRVIVAGDSTAAAFGTGVVGWAAERPDLAQAEAFSARGCGFLTEGQYWLGDGWFDIPDNCPRWVDEHLPERVAEARPDVVMMMTTSFDVLDRRFDGGEGLEPAAMRPFIADSFSALTDELLRRGAATVVWVNVPVPNPFWMSLGTQQEQPQRHAVLDSVMAEIADTRPNVEVVDLRSYFAEKGLDDDTDVRPDGLHVDPDAATEIATDFLGEQLVRAALGLL